MEDCYTSDGMNFAFILGMVTVLAIMGFFSMLTSFLRWLSDRFR